jgi:hypothetical protein
MTDTVEVDMIVVEEVDTIVVDMQVVEFDRKQVDIEI